MNLRKSANNYIDEIWRTGQELGLTNSDIHNVFASVIAEEEYKEAKQACKSTPKDLGAKERPSVLWRIFAVGARVVKFGVLIILLLICCCGLIYLHNPARKLVMRNVQDMIYPVMTTLRHMALPVLSRYPHLSQWYSEECLLPNTFFDHPNIDCDSCEEETVPVYVTGLNNFVESYYNNGKLLIVLDAMPVKMTWKSIVEMVDIQDEIRLGYWKYFSKSRKVINLGENNKESENLWDGIHVEWKVSRLDTIHAVRKMFPRSYFIPQDTEVALHRHMFIDGPGSDPYSLPLTEFANIVLMQGEGKSRITMLPSNHCRNICKPITVTLDTSQVLFFNWVYWRPVRQAGSSVSTLLMSSFY